MDHRIVTALAVKLRRVVGLSKPRVETLSLLILGLFSARTVNLTHLACERSGVALVASTYRRFQRFFQHVRLPQDWAAEAVAGMTDGAATWTLCLDRTCWQVGHRHVNFLVLALVTPRCRVPLMWSLLDWKGNSGAPERVALMERFIAKFGKHRIGLLLADREFIGYDWFNYLVLNDIPFVIRMLEGHHVLTAAGARRKLVHLFARRDTHAFGPGKIMASLPANRPGMPDLPLCFEAKQIEGGDRLVVATNRPGLGALKAYRKRWAIECLFADTKSRGFNFEDTHLRDLRKLDLLMSIIALAAAWASRVATRLIGAKDLPRKPHGYYAKSWFRTGFDHIRNLLRNRKTKLVNSWPIRPSPERVV